MPLNVFYLDDEEALCENFADYFSSSDVVISTFTDPFLALTAAEKNPPDLIFIDYRMPQITGDKVATSLAASIPKYLITGDPNVEVNYKFEAKLGKPYEVEDIQTILDKFTKLKATA